MNAVIKTDIFCFLQKNSAVRTGPRLVLYFLLIFAFFPTVPPEEATRKRPEYTAFQALDILLGTISILNLVSLTIERLIAVKYPAYHFNLTWKPVAKVLCLTWVLGVIIAGIGFLVDVHIKRDEYMYFLFIIDFAIPTVVISACYIIIFRVAQDSATMASKRIRNDVKIARMILVIIGLFLLCWLPFFALSITYYNCSDWCHKIPTSLIAIFKAMHYSNSMMNFFVYAARSPDFRRSFSALIRWKVPRLRSETVTSFRMRQRTLSHPYNSNDNHLSQCDFSNNDTLATPLPDRANGNVVHSSVV